jgi:type I restriction enzyme S subunit
MAVENLITEHLDIWTSAIKTKSAAGRGSSKKLELVGVKKLRELILELAVRGKLVPQDPNDEPASELIKKIASEKVRLLKEGKIKKQKSLPHIGEEEKPIVIPTSWCWERLENVINQVTDGEHLSPKKALSGVKLLTAKHVRDNGVTTEDPQYVSEKDAEKFLLRCKPEMGDILICSRGTIGRTCVND